MTAAQALEVGLAVGGLTGCLIGLWVGYLVGVATAHRDTVIELERVLDEPMPDELRNGGAL